MLPPARLRALPSQHIAGYSLQHAGTLSRLLLFQTCFLLPLTAVRHSTSPTANIRHRIPCL